MKQFSKSHATWNLLSRNMVPAGGRGQLIVPIQTKLVESFHGITEGGTLPTSKATGSDEASFSLQEFGGRYEVTWKAMSDSRSNKFAFRRIVGLMDESIRLSIFQSLSNELLDNGLGRLAIMPAADNSSPVTVQLPIRARIDQDVDIMDQADDDTLHLDGGTISDISYADRTITVSGTVTGTGANDYFSIAATTDDSKNDALHMAGLLAAIDSSNPASVVGNYGGIDRTSKRYWRAHVSTASTNRPLSEDLLLNEILEARLEGGGDIDALLTNPRIFARYYDLAKEERTFPMSPNKNMSANLGPDGLFNQPADGKTKFQFAGRSLYLDDYGTSNTILGIDRKTFAIAHGQNKMPQPVSDVFGNPKFRDVANTASYEIAWWWLGQLICNAPGRNIQWNAIEES